MYWALFKKINVTNYWIINPFVLSLIWVYIDVVTSSNHPDYHSYGVILRNMNISLQISKDTYSCIECLWQSKSDCWLHIYSKSIFWHDSNHITFWIGIFFQILWVITMNNKSNFHVTPLAAIHAILIILFMIIYIVFTPGMRLMGTDNNWSEMWKCRCFGEFNLTALNTRLSTTYSLACWLNFTRFSCASMFLNEIRGGTPVVEKNWCEDFEGWGREGDLSVPSRNGSILNWKRTNQPHLYDLKLVLTWLHLKCYELLLSKHLTVLRTFRCHIMLSIFGFAYLFPRIILLTQCSPTEYCY